MLMVSSTWQIVLGDQMIFVSIGLFIFGKINGSSRYNGNNKKTRLLRPGFYI